MHAQIPLSASRLPPRRASKPPSARSHAHGPDATASMSTSLRPSAFVNGAVASLHAAPSLRGPDTAVLEHLLQSTPEAPLLAVVLDNAANADGFDYRRFVQTALRAHARCAPSDLPALREQLCQALRDRAGNGGFDPPLGHRVAASLLGGVPWTALHAAAAAMYGPQARLAMTAAQWATTLLPRLSQGSWQAAVAATHLLPLSSVLPSMRNIAQVDALVDSLPEAVRHAVWTLHATLAELEERLAPAAPGTLALVAVAAVLWRLYEGTSEASAPVYGDASTTLIGLPRTLAGAAQWHQRLAGLFAPVSAEAAQLQRLQQDIQGFTAIRQRLDTGVAQGRTDDQVIGEVLEAVQAEVSRDSGSVLARPAQALRRILGRYVGAPSASVGLCTDLSASLREHVSLLQAQMPAMPLSDHIDPHVAGSLFAGDGPGTCPTGAGMTCDATRLATRAEAESGASAGSAASVAASSWGAWLISSVPAALRQIRSLDSDAMPGAEQVHLQRAGADDEADGNLQEVVAGAAHTAQQALARTKRPGFGARHPGAYTALVGVGGTLVTYGLVTAGRALWPESSESTTSLPPPISPEAAPESCLAALETAASHIVDSGDGVWRSALEGSELMSSVGSSRQVAAGDEVRNSTAASPTRAAGGGHALDATSLNNLATAVTEDLARRTGQAWLLAAPASEQALYAHALHDLRRAAAGMQKASEARDALFGQRLEESGWTGPWNDITVTINPSHARGTAPRDTVPLDMACLHRPFVRSSTYTFFDQGKALDTAAQGRLRRFLASDECAGLNAQVKAHGRELQDAARSAAWAQLKVDALEAKMRGIIGPANGAGLVLEFLQAAPSVESAAMHFSLAVDGGETLDITLPGYLVLRRNGAHADSTGDIVVYRMPTGAFTVFSSTRSMRDYFNERNAKQDTLAGLDVPWSLSRDLLEAVPPQHAVALRDALKVRAERPTDWDIATNLQWNFQPTEAASVSAWVDQVAASEQARLQQQWDLSALDWSAAGLRAKRAQQRWSEVIAGLDTFHDHAKPAAQTYFHRVMKNIDRTLASPLDPDLIELDLNNRRANLTEWATRYWAHEGLRRPIIGGLWPATDVLAGIRITVFKRESDGTRTIDPVMTERLSWESNQRHLIKKLDDLVTSNRLGDAYASYLEGLSGSAKERELAAAQAELSMARVQLMIDRAQVTHQIPAATWKTLSAAAAHQRGALTSPFRGVAVDGREIPGLWALEAGPTHHVFVVDGPDGDAVMEASEFQRWLRRSDEAEGYINRRALYADHKALAASFAARRSSTAMQVTFPTTGGPFEEARKLLTHRLANLDELTTTQWERLGGMLDVLGTVMVSGACVLGSGGAGLMVCGAGTAAFFLRGLHDGMRAAEQGDHAGATEAYAGAVLDGIDVLELTRLPALAFRVGKEAFATLDEARRAVQAIHQQHRAFTATGSISPSFPRRELPTGSVPVPVSGDPQRRLYRHEGKEYIASGAGGYIETTVDASGVRRMRDPQHPDSPSMAVTFDGSEWLRLDALPDPVATVGARVRELIPDAAALGDAALRRVLAIQGVSQAGQLSAVARSAVVRAGHAARVQHALRTADVLHLQGTPALAALWARTPVVNGGLRVDIVPPIGSGQRRVALGQGDGALISLAPSDLPALSLQTLIQRADRQALARRLGLAADIDDAGLRTTVMQHLQQTLATDTQPLVQDWARVVDGLASLPQAAVALRGYYPGVSTDEAIDLLRADRGLLGRVTRGEPMGTEIAELVGRRRQREIRRTLLQGRINRLDEINTLGILLQDSIRASSVRVRSAGSHIELQLQRPGPVGSGTRSDLIRFDEAGNVQFHGTRGWQDATDWKTAVTAVLTPEDRIAMAGPDVGDAVRQAMANHPWGVSCPPGGKRTLCPVAGTTRVAPGEVRDTVAAELFPQAVHARQSVQPGVSRALAAAETDARAVLDEIGAQRFAAVDTLGEVELKKLGAQYNVGWSKTTTAETYRPALKTAITQSRSRLAGLKSKALAVQAKRLSKADDLHLTAQQKEHLAHYVDVFTFNDGRKYELANVMTAKANLEWKGQPLEIKGTYTSNKVIAGIDGSFKSPVEPELVVIKAHLKPGTVIGDTPLDDQFYIHDTERLRRYPDRYLFGMDVWPLTAVKRLDDGMLQFAKPRMMTVAEKERLAAKGFKQESLDDINEGDYFYEAGFRACSEAAFLKELLDGLRKMDADAFSADRYLANMAEVKGRIALYTETAPCDEVCRRRLTDLIEHAPNIQIEVGYSFPGVEAAKPYRSGDGASSAEPVGYLGDNAPASTGAEAQE